MGALKKTAVRITEKGERQGERFWFWCSGCETHHAFTTKLASGETGPCWQFDGNETSPTFSPSLLCNPKIRKVCDCPDSEECVRDDHAYPAYGHHRCHLFLRAGMVQYLGDCTHKLKGQTVPVESPRF